MIMVFEYYTSKSQNNSLSKLWTLFQSHNQSIIPFQALGTLRFISDLDDIDFPSELIGIDIKKETIIYPEELHANEFEIEDLKPCIADLDLKNTIKVKKVIKKKGEGKKRVRRKKGINSQYGCYSYIVYPVKMNFVFEITIFGLRIMVKSGQEVF